MGLKNVLLKIKHKFTEITVDNIIWWMNLTPRIAGFPILKRNHSVIFWFIHFSFLSYINFLSNFIYRIKLAEDVDGIVQANTNLSVVIFTMNISLWFFIKGSQLITTLEKIRQIDKLSSDTDSMKVKHYSYIKKLKIFVLVYYLMNFANTHFIWMPQRMDLTSTFYTEYPCPGINVTTVITTYICRAIIFIQDVTISTVVINFQSVLLFLIAHTAAMYHLLSDEMSSLTESTTGPIGAVDAQEKMSSLIKRHVLLLDIIQCLKSMYNMAIGINFGSNAYCICLFFFLNLEAWISFAPLIGYCFVVFFMYCYLCQKLIDATVVFEKAVYACGWEILSLSDMKAVYIILQQSQKPVLLMAGYMIPVNIYTFATSMQFIYKFVTALKF